jgi:C4-dicarboxylate-specific signal transduction histidine kinase
MMPFSRNTRTIQPLWIPIAVLGGLLLVSLVVQLTLAWLSYDRILPVNRHVDHLERLQNTLHGVENTLAEQLPHTNPLPADVQLKLRRSLQTLLREPDHLAADTPAQIQQAQKALETLDTNPRSSLLQVLSILREVFRQEAVAHKSLVQTIHRGALMEIEIAVITLLILPASAFVLLMLMRRRIFSPLQQMSYLMAALGNRQYQRIPLENVDPMFQPLLENYNHMAIRLSELEAEHLQHEQHLEQQVKKAARTLVEQQRSLANTERLAALGEVMARLAHELRNPLAGVKMACSNIKQEIAESGVDAPHKSRIELVGKEIDRMIEMLNHLLDQAHHQPEQVREVQLDSAVGDLLTLARYQIPGNIRLHHEIPPGIICRLPDTELRQALLNLILNAQQALGEQQGTVSILAALDGTRLTIRVIDDGPGFPADVLEDGIRAFKTRRIGGTGLGLSMVQRFTRNQGGKLLISNREPHGACVTLELNCVLNHHA